MPRAGTSTRVTINSMSLRSGPGGSHGIVRTLPAGTQVIVLGELDGSSVVGHRLKVLVDGQAGWISAGSVANINIPATNTRTRFTTNNMSLRFGPGGAHGVIRTLPPGTKVTVIRRTFWRSDCWT